MYQLAVGVLTALGVVIAARGSQSVPDERTLEEMRAVWDEMARSPLLAPESTRVWEARYESVSELNVSRDPAAPRGRIVNVVPIAGPRPNSTFEVREALLPGQHHLRLTPALIAEAHRNYSFGRGMEYWSIAEGRSVSVDHDKRTARIGGNLARAALAPNDLPLPMRLTTEGLARDKGRWAGAYVDTKQTSLEDLREESRELLAPDAGKVRLLETVVHPGLLLKNEPVKISRLVCYDPQTAMLPVEVEFRLGGLIAGRWTLTWKPSGPEPGPIEIRGHRLESLRADKIDLASSSVLATVTYVPKSSGRPQLDEMEPIIPESYKVFDVDQAATERAAQAAETEAARRAKESSDLRTCQFGACGNFHCRTVPTHQPAPTSGEDLIVFEVHCSRSGEVAGCVGAGLRRMCQARAARGVALGGIDVSGVTL